MGKIGVASMEDKMRDVRLLWLGHIRRRLRDASVRRCEMMESPKYKSRDRPKKSWSEVIRQDLKTLRLVEDMAQDKKILSSRIKVVDF